MRRDPTRARRSSPTSDDVDTAATVLTLESGTLAVVSNSRYNGRGYDVRLELHGSNDSVAAGLEHRWPIRSTEPGVTLPGGTPHHFFMDRFADAFRAELAAFTEVVAGSRPSPCTVADAVEVGWIAEAADCRCTSIARSAWTRSDRVQRGRAIP